MYCATETPIRVTIYSQALHLFRGVVTVSGKGQNKIWEVETVEQLVWILLRFRLKGDRLDGSSEDLMTRLHFNFELRGACGVTEMGNASQMTVDERQDGCQGPTIEFSQLK